MKKWLGVVLAAVFCAAAVQGGSQHVQRFTLFAGDCDSTEQVTVWIPIKGANRVTVRTWSTHLGFGGNADSTKVDSIAGMNVLLSDSLTSDSGVLAAADSFLVPVTVAGDTARKMVAFYPWPIKKVLRGPANGWGLHSQLIPTQDREILVVDHNMVFQSEAMRIRFTPERRATAATGLATVPNRTNGLRGLKMVAHVYWNNR